MTDYDNGSADRDAALRHSLETAKWLRGNGELAAGDELERKARTLQNQKLGE